MNRAVGALKLRSNWIQLAKFGVVGASGYAINLGRLHPAAWAGRPRRRGDLVHRRAPRATTGGTGTGRSLRPKGTSAYQGIRFFAVSAVALIANQVWLLVFLDWLGWGKVISQALSIALVVPLNFLGNKLWSFRALKLLAALVAALVVVPVASAATDDAVVDLLRCRQRPIGQRADAADVERDRSPRRSSSTTPKVAALAQPLPAEPAGDRDLLRRRLDGRRLLGQGRRDRDGPGRRRAGDRDRGLHRPAGRLVDGSRHPGRVRRKRRSTATRCGSAFCGLFLLGLIDWRRLRSLRNLDLLVLLSLVGLAVVLQPRSRLRVRDRCLPAALLAARALRAGSVGATARRAGRRSGRCGCLPVRPSSSVGSGSG